MRRLLWRVDQKGNNGTGWNPSLPGGSARLSVPCVVSFGAWVRRGIVGRGGTRPYREAARAGRPMRRLLWRVDQKGNNGTGWNPSLPGGSARLGVPCAVSFGAWIRRGIMGRGGTRPYREAPRAWASHASSPLARGSEGE